MNYYKLCDEIERLFKAGYTCDYPPLAELLKEWEEINAREEKIARLNEVIDNDY